MKKQNSLSSRLVASSISIFSRVTFKTLLFVGLWRVNFLFLTVDNWKLYIWSYPKDYQMGFTVNENRLKAWKSGQLFLLLCNECSNINVSFFSRSTTTQSFFFYRLKLISPICVITLYPINTQIHQNNKKPKTHNHLFPRWYFYP